MPMPIGARPDYRDLIVTGRLVFAVSVRGQLSPVDGAIELVDISLDLRGPDPHQDEGGEVVLGPLTQQLSPGATATAVAPLNSALRLLGARAADGVDEFDAVGLGRHRHVEDWARG